MTLKSTLRWGLSAWFLIRFLTVFSQDSDTVKNYLIDEVMISATRTEKKILDIPKSVTIITGQQLKQSGANNLAEILSTQEGINIIGANQNPGANQSFFMRGSGSEQSVVMIDGIRITDPSSNTNAVDLSEISLINIKRIEIVRGTHSTLYGSSAIGGTINIITDKKLNPGINIAANADIGTFGPATSQLNEALKLNYTFNNGLYISGKIFHSNIKGLDAVLDTVTTEGVFKNNDRDDFAKTDMISKIGYSSGKIDAFFSYIYVNQFVDADASAYQNDENNTINFSRKMFNYHFGYEFNPKINLSFNGGNSFLTRINKNDSSLVSPGIFDKNYYTGTFKGKLFNNEIQLNYIADHFTVVAGGGIYKEMMTSNSYTYSGLWDYESWTDLDTLNLQTILSNFYISSEVNGSVISSGLAAFTMMLGVRFNSDDRHGKYVTYELNPYLKLSKNAMVYGSMSTGFNSPPLYKLYTPESYYMSGITRGNPSLQPEKSLSLETGLKYWFRNNYLFTFSIYKNNIKNSIQYVYLWDKNLDIELLGTDWMRDDYRGDTYLNIGTMKSRGVEISLWANPIKNLTLRGNINLQDGRLEYNPDEIDESVTDGNQVQLFESGRFLKNQINLARLTRRSDNYNVTVDYKFTHSSNVGISIQHIGRKNDIFYSAGLLPYGALDSRLLKGYTLVNFSVRQQFTKYLVASIRINNVFNTNYVEILGYSTKKRGIYLNLDFSL